MARASLLKAMTILIEELENTILVKVASKNL